MHVGRARFLNNCLADGPGRIRRSTRAYGQQVIVRGNCLRDLGDEEEATLPNWEAERLPKGSASDMCDGVDDEKRFYSSEDVCAFCVSDTGIVIL